MFIPQSTYRIQLSPSFTLPMLENIIPYLHELDISTIYASPIFQAAPGSEHGYDVTDPLKINPELGTLDDLYRIAALLKKHNMSWLQDIVPNHMAYHPDNEWLMDIFEKGKVSAYYHFFDIDWEYNGRVMAPFLGSPFAETLSNGEIELTFSNGRFFLAYYDHQYPLHFKSYEWLMKQTNSSGDSIEQLIFINKNFSLGHWKAFLKRLKQNEQLITEILKKVNANKKLLQLLHDQQTFEFTHWQQTEKQINYRRFFTINGLICLRQEDEQVFEKSHQLVLELVKNDTFQGLRIDHIDGLYNPGKYCQWLREATGWDTYIVLEKILELEELIPGHWPVQGTSGYDYLALSNQLFTDHRHREYFNRLYRQLIPDTPSYKNQVYKNKLFILEERMGGELDNLLRLLGQSKLIPANYPKKQFSKALAVFMAAFPIYRIYPEKLPLTGNDRQLVLFTLEKSKEQLEGHKSAFELLENILLKGNSEATLHFFRRLQQFTGPLAAKGVEDTTFYTFNRLISHNEVGDTPAIFGLGADEFHRKMQERLGHFPHAINTTSTHDTKRGEDARLCVNVLSEIPNSWREYVQHWMQINAHFTDRTKGQRAPSKNDEYFLYQTLIGVYPMIGQINEFLIQRVKDYMIKSVREAKEHSNWSAPNEPYEVALNHFVKAILTDYQFKESFLHFYYYVARVACIYSLGQVALKLTAPGIPDIYQGCELWNLSLVDPDNRRPVDYAYLQQRLQELKRLENENIDLHSNLLGSIFDGNIKLYTTWKLLQLRKENAVLFENGDYEPLIFKGVKKDQLFGFIRSYNDHSCAVIIPLLLAESMGNGDLPVGDFWENTTVELPKAGKWKALFGNRPLKGSKIAIADLLAFPVGILYCASN